MKKISLFAVLAALTLTLSACGDEQPNTSAPTPTASDPSIQDGPSNDPNDVLE